MDRSVPAAAARLLDFIYRTETDKGPPGCYEVVYGHNQHKLPKPITSMTLNEIEAAQSTWSRRFGSSAAGAPQFMRNTLDAPGTLKDLEGEMGLTGKEKFTPDLQDRMAYHLLKRRGYEAFVAGKMSRTEFGKRLAQEWASFPVLAACQGAKRKLKRGQSYYAGDGLNKALVRPEEVEAVLEDVLRIARQPAREKPAAAELDEETIERVQQQLKDLGYTEVGGIDGKIGTMTAAAIRAFRAENGLPPGDGIDDELLLALQKAKPRKIAPERENAPPDVVREKVPEVRSNWLTKIVAFFAGLFGLLGSLVDGILGNLSAARGYVEPLTGMVADVPGWAWLLLVAAIAAGLYWNAHRGEQKGIEAFQTGARR